eukprot:TRINITY_DN4811_c0_g1_i4.p2 TRINITY_DN4811_c0_g1~~TRINITY_DN4811_c0_g1_i4.p2  ORF type:complete len:119 (+),score=25.26 TRINITY_DN4811_c0_g1_i4:154-510(+)
MQQERTGGFLHFQYSRHSVRVKEGRAWADVVEDLKRLVTLANPPVAPPTTAELAPGVQEFVNNNFDMPDDKISQAVTLRVIDAVTRPVLWVVRVVSCVLLLIAGGIKPIGLVCSWCKM